MKTLQDIADLLGTDSAGANFYDDIYNTLVQKEQQIAHCEAVKADYEVAKLDLAKAQADLDALTAPSE